MSSPFNIPDESFQGFFKAGRNLLKALTPLPSPPGEAAAPARGTPLAQRQMDCLQQQLALWARGPRPRAAAGGSAPAACCRGVMLAAPWIVGVAGMGLVTLLWRAPMRAAGPSSSTGRAKGCSIGTVFD